MNMTPTAHARSEWLRIAADAYRTGRNVYGHRYSVASATGDTLPLAVYDTLQRVYRMWLNDGWKAVDGN